MCFPIKDKISLLIQCMIITFGCLGVQAGEFCYTDYYTLEFCDHGCCGTDVTDRHCCTKPVDLGTIIGCSVGGAVLLIIIIIIIVLLCKYNTRTKDIHPDENTLSSISEHTEDNVLTRCDTSCNHRFPGVIKVYPGMYTKRVGINSHVIREAPHSDEEDGTSSRQSESSAPPVFFSRASTSKSLYRDAYTPSEPWDIPDIVTD